jgi:peptide-methionine (R)-S-oxide reductase
MGRLLLLFFLLYSCIPNNIKISNQSGEQGPVLNNISKFEFRTDNWPHSHHLEKIDLDKKNWREMPLSYWREVLTPLQFKVTREAGTEPPFDNLYNSTKAEGIYVCSNCGLPLFSSIDKYDSKTGWPSFRRVLTSSNIETKIDLVIGFPRVEILCKRCGAHLGHLFKDGPPPEGNRYCINSVSLLLLNQKKE